MILPTKHLPHDRALLSVAAVIARLMSRSTTVSSLWETFSRSQATSQSGQVTYDWFILALDFLFALDVLELSDGSLRLR